jgi:glucose-1-phosphate adenylyltransferase
MVIAALPVLEPEAKRMGLLKINALSTITDFYEKPQDPDILKEYELSKAFLKENGKKTDHPQYLASMGIYIFKRKALIEILKQQGDDFGRDLIPKFIRAAKCSAYLYEGYWEDIGTVSSYYKANLLLTEGKGLNTYIEDNRIYSSPQHVPNAMILGTRIDKSFIGPGSIIQAESIEHSVVGFRSLIKKGTVIRDSIIAGNRTYHPFLDQVMPADQYYSIGENCVISNAIIDEECRIGNNVQLINKDNLDRYDGDGVFIRDGIIIVTTGTEVPDNFVL